MNKAKHTQGPWTANELGEEDGTWHKWSISAHGPLAYGGDNSKGGENSRANALLMAAAPDLLAALDELLATHELREYKGERITPMESNAMKQARAAIAKARGN